MSDDEGKASELEDDFDKNMQLVNEELNSLEAKKDFPTTVKKEVRFSNAHEHHDDIEKQKGHRIKPSHSHNV